MPSPFKVLIVDDEGLARDSIRILLENKPDCLVIGEAKNGYDALIQIEKNNPDIVFLDIQMPEKKGLEVIKSIKRNRTPAFVMVTAFDEYAVKAFELNAIDYLLKPYTDERFYQSLNRAIEKVTSGNSLKELELLKDYLESSAQKPQSNGKLVIKSAGKIQLVEKRMITHIKASGNYCEIYTAEKKHLMYSSISELEKELDSNRFIRIHRSSIVNIECIKELESHFNGEYIIHLNNGEQLKLSRSYRDKLEVILGA